jgi:hypothetical protein
MLDEMKKDSNKIAQGTPPSPKVKPPVIAAAKAPLREREPARHASSAMMIASRTPMISCMRNICLNYVA